MSRTLLKLGILSPLAFSTFLSASPAHASEPDATPAPYAVGTTPQSDLEEMRALRDVLDNHILEPWLLQLEEASGTAATDIRSHRIARYAAQLYIVEKRLVSHLETLAEHAVLSDEAFDTVRAKVIPLLGRLQWNYPSLIEAMRSMADKRNPGRSGATEVHRHERYVGTPGGGVVLPIDIYEPTWLSEQTLTPAQKTAAYEKAVATYRAKHGPDAPLYHSLVDVVNNRMSGHIFEWVVMPTDEVRATPDGKHALMAEGGGVTAAGGSRVFKRTRRDGSPQSYLALVSNWTGTYQSDMATTTKFIPKLAEATALEETAVVLTPAMPMSPRTFENILVASGLPKDKARRAGAQLVKHANRLASTDRERVKGLLLERGIPLRH